MNYLTHFHVIVMKETLLNEQEHRLLKWLNGIDNLLLPLKYKLNGRFVKNSALLSKHVD